MKKMMWAMAAFSLVLGFTACGKQKQETSTESQEVAHQEKAAKTLQRSPNLKNKHTAELGGKKYEITISRISDSTLPKVRDEFNTEFCDNRVEVQITTGGSEVFSHTFTKESFSENLSDKEKLGTIFLGMAFDLEKSDKNNICLGAQIGLAGIEEGPAFSVKVPLHGGSYTIARDMNQDTTGDDGNMEE